MEIDGMIPVFRRDNVHTPVERESNANLAEAFLKIARARPGHPFLVDSDGRYSLAYGQLDELTGRLAGRLRKLGSVPGDRVLVQVDKSPEAVLLYLAALRAGLVFVPLNTAYTSAELEDFIRDAEPAVVVCRPAVQAQVVDILGPSSGVAVVTLGDDGTGTLFADMPSVAAPVEEREPSDLASILYTSGTTGRSKGAMLTHGNLLSNAETLRDLWRWSRDDVLIHVLPIYHIHGLFVALHGALLVGATVLFHRGFVPEAVIEDFGRATVFMGVPTHYTRLMKHPKLSREKATRMRLFVSGSAPLLAETHRQFETLTGHRILERYGMTEAGMIASNPYDGERVAGTVGYALPGVQVRICDENGAELDAGQPGILEVKGPNVFVGYWRRPEKTADDFRPDRFFKTGDIATRAVDGRITLVGRAKDLIIAGGLNIYPKEIEDTIDTIPGVQESAVIGVPHADLGEAVVAVVVTEPGAPDDLDQVILKALEPRLARFKRPRKVIVVDTLPRNAMGKVQKTMLRAAYSQLFSRSSD
jgi:malonyl-CoA/methylmalonyl-CoA synthetase